MLLLMALINPAFNHEGVTIIKYLPGGNPLTLESIIYGFCAAVMIASVICHFSCYNEVVTSDKFIYLFGRVIPALSLVISMTLRFIPKFTNQLKVVTNAQKCIGRDVTCGSLLSRLKNGINILSIMITWSFENAIETADSMTSRGYGIGGRTAFSIFKFDKRDKNALGVILVLGVCTFAGSISGTVGFEFFPMIKMADVSLLGVSTLLSYLLLCTFPIFIEIREVRKWNALKSKI